MEQWRRNKVWFAVTRALRTTQATNIAGRKSPSQSPNLRFSLPKYRNWRTPPLPILPSPPPSRHRRALQNTDGSAHQDDSKVLHSIMQQTHTNSMKLRITFYLFSLVYGKRDFNKKLNEIDIMPKITIYPFQTKLLQYKICDLDSLASSKNAARCSNVASVFFKRCLY